MPTLFCLMDKPVKTSLQNILIVDDDPESLRLLGRLLAQQGYRIHVAESGPQALEIAEKMADKQRLHLILLDILMPGRMDGIETCRRLKACPATCDTPVIFLTGKFDTKTTLEAFEAGGADFVSKPFDTRVLLARVRTHAQLYLFSKRLEQVLAERTRELNDANAALRRLTLEMSQIEERERERLANDLHDSPMQKLALAQAQIVSATQYHDEESDRQLETGLELMRDALQELRSLQFELSPPVLRREGLAPALAWLASYCTRRLGVSLSFVESGTADNFGHDLKVMLYRFARELVNNLAKHAEALSGQIELQVSDDEIRLTVSDNGKGFPRGKARPRGEIHRTYGLNSICEQLSLLGGELSITTEATGSRVSIRIPRPADSADRSGTNQGLSNSADL